MTPLPPENNDGPIGRIFDISRGCIDDGPGLRTVVFLKGCNLHCPWCHNPEGRSFHPEIAFDAARCVDCGICHKICPRNWKPNATHWRTGCTACGRCTEACPAGARRLVGRNYSVRSLTAEVIGDIDFFKGTGGGVTFSGGEPMAQPDFLMAAASALKAQGIHVALETAGYWPETFAADVARGFDLVLFDIKHVTEERLKKSAGCSGKTALKNLQGLIDMDCRVEVRFTLVPGFNDGPSDLQQVANWLSTCNPYPVVRLQPFHRLAAAKQNLYGKPYPFANATPTSRSQLADAARVLRERSLTVQTDETDPLVYGTDE